MNEEKLKKKKKNFRKKKIGKLKFLEKYCSKNVIVTKLEEKIKSKKLIYVKNGKQFLFFSISFF